MRYSCVLVDDEPLALMLLEKYLLQYPFIKLTMKTTRAAEAIVFMQKHPTDLLFLDIRMPQLNGFTVLEAIPAKPLVIITTAYRDYAPESFDVGAIDYLLKPIRLERFNQAIEKVRPLLERQRLSLPTEVLPTAELRILVGSGSKKVWLKPEEVFYLESSREYTFLHTAREKHVMKRSLKATAALFPAGYFVQVHKSYMVASNHIRLKKGNALLINEVLIPVGRRYKKNLE